jgi:hypothetical protein
MKKFFVVFLAAFLAFSPAWAASARRLPVAYTQVSVGTGGDYATIAAAEDATDNDLVTATSGVVINMLAGTHSTAAVNFSGATVNSSYFRVIRAAPGYERQAILTHDAGCWTVAVGENYLSIQDVIIRNTGNASGGFIAGVVGNGAENSIVGCEIGPIPNSTFYPVWGVYSYGGGSSYVVNTYIHETSEARTGSAGIYSENGTIYAYNCTIDTTRIALYGSTGSITAKNTIGRNLTATTSGTVTATDCLLTTGAGLVSFDTVPYLAADDTTAKDQGADLSADAAFAFDDAYDLGESRGASWDIGADEYQTPAPVASGTSIFFFQ